MTDKNLSLEGSQPNDVVWVQVESPSDIPPEEMEKISDFLREHLNREIILTKGDFSTIPPDEAKRIAENLKESLERHS